jgi:putative transposase
MERIHLGGRPAMRMKRCKPEQIVTVLRQIEVEKANGKTTVQACNKAEITPQTYYRWRKEFGGFKLDQAKRLEELERKNLKLTRLVVELSRWRSRF